MKDEIKISTFFDNLMEKDANVVLKLTCLASNFKTEAWGGGGGGGGGLFLFLFLIEQSTKFDKQ